MSAPSGRRTDQRDATPPADADEAVAASSGSIPSETFAVEPGGWHGGERGPAPTGIAENLARMISSRSDELQPGGRERAMPLNVLRPLAILAVPTMIAAAVSLFVMTGLRSEALQRMDWDRAPDAERAATPSPSALGPGTGREAEGSASSLQRRDEEVVRLAELESRRADLARAVEGLVSTEGQKRQAVAELTDAERQRGQALAEMESRWAEMARTVDGLADVDRQRRQELSEVESRRAGLERMVESLAASERDARQALDDLTAQRQAEAQQLAELERRRDAAATATVRLDARQQSLTQALVDLERNAADAPARSADDAFSELEDLALDASATEFEQRVFVHYSASEPGAEALADRVARDLADRGVTVADIRPVGFDIGTSRVRYFFGDEARAAPAIGAMVAGSLGSSGGSAPEVQDFTRFEPKPSQGTIEVWLTRSKD